MNTLLITIDDETRKQVDALTRAVGKPEKEVMSELVKAGLKTYQTTPTKSVKALLDLAEWAEKNNITAPKDLGTQELLTIPTSWQETHLQDFSQAMPLQFCIETLGRVAHKHPS